MVLVVHYGSHQPASRMSYKNMFILIIDESGTAENKEELLFSHDKLFAGIHTEAASSGH